MYWKEIIWLLTWPFLIAMGYFVARQVLKKIEKFLPENE